MTVAYLSLGSNIEPKKNLVEAIRLLSRHVKILKLSTVYLTQPLLHRNQPSYHNCVIKIETEIEPLKLKFDVLRAIESKLKRKRTEDKYASRTIDIDIILYDDLRLSTKELVLPDPEIEKRPFLAIPLYELEPGLKLPTNKSIREIATRFRNPKMTPLRGFTASLSRCLESMREES